MSKSVQGLQSEMMRSTELVRPALTRCAFDTPGTSRRSGVLTTPAAMLTIDGKIQNTAYFLRHRWSSNLSNPATMKRLRRLVILEDKMEPLDIGHRPSIHQDYIVYNIKKSTLIELHIKF